LCSEAAKCYGHYHRTQHMYTCMHHIHDLLTCMSPCVDDRRHEMMAMTKAVHAPPCQMLASGGRPPPSPGALHAAEAGASAMKQPNRAPNAHQMSNASDGNPLRATWLMRRRRPLPSHEVIPATAPKQKSESGAHLGKAQGFPPSKYWVCCCRSSVPQVP